MKTLLECKDAIAHRHGHQSWGEMHVDLKDWKSRAHELAELYASQFKESDSSISEAGRNDSETGEQEDKPAVTITLSFDVPTFGKFISFMKTNDDLWPDFKESLMQLKDKIESWKEMK